MVEVRVTRQFPHPRERVFDVYTDHWGWSRWAGVPMKITREGVDDRRGVGLVRVIPGGYHEEVTRFEPHSEMRYRLFKGLGIAEHEGIVTFEEADGGTRVEWVVRIRPSIPLTGALLRLGLGAAFSRVLRLLEAELGR